MCPPKVVIGDGDLVGGRNVFPKAEEQRCWNHRVLNVLEKVPKKKQNSAKRQLLSLPQLETRAETEREKKKFVEDYTSKYLKGVASLEREW